MIRITMEVSGETLETLMELTKSESEYETATKVKMYVNTIIKTQMSGFVDDVNLDVEVVE